MGFVRIQGLKKTHPKAGKEMVGTERDKKLLSFTYNLFLPNSLLLCTAFPDLRTIRAAMISL